MKKEFLKMLLDSLKIFRDSSSPNLEKNKIWIVPVDELNAIQMTIDVLEDCMNLEVEK